MEVDERSGGLKGKARGDSEVDEIIVGTHVRPKKEVNESEGATRVASALRTVDYSMNFSSFSRGEVLGAARPRSNT